MQIFKELAKFKISFFIGIILLFVGYKFFYRIADSFALTSNQERTSYIGKTNDMFEAADVKNGALLSQTCLSCHSFKKGDAKKNGPNLSGVVGRGIASKDDYIYSDALTDKKSQFWTIDNLDAWLTDPSDFAPGTKMDFGGILDPQDRMDIIAYLKTL